jgi:hypothetical protein
MTGQGIGRRDRRRCVVLGLLLAGWTGMGWGGGRVLAQAMGSGPDAGAKGDLPVPVVSTNPELPNLVVTSEPSGAVVTLVGPYEWTGQTPWQLYREVSGLYQVEAHLPGYEPYHGEVMLGSGGVRELRIHLSRQTRWKAAGRSLLLPGWGQAYAGSRVKGIALGLATIAAAGGWIYTNELYQDKVDVFRQRESAYVHSTRQADLAPLRAAAQRASDSADRAYDRRRILIAATAGLYAISALDAIFFFPSAETGPSASSDQGRNRMTEPEPFLAWTAAVGPHDETRVGLTYHWR